MSSYRRGRTVDFVLPFLILVCLGVILVLIFQLYFTWKEENEVTLRNQVFLYYDDGRASLFPWGAEQWSKAYSGSLVLEGDRVKTDAGTSLVLSFFNGAVVRLDENTIVTYHTFSDVDGVQVFSLDLESGRLWINEDALDDSVVHFSVTMGDLVATSTGTVFEVTRSSTEKIVRVLSGSVQADIFESVVYDLQTQTPITSQTIGVGQQITLSTSVKARLLAREQVSLLDSLDDDWKTSAWYLWNIQEDASPTDFAALLKQKQTMIIPTQDALIVTPSVSLPTLTLTNPSNSPFVVDGTQFYITGTASSDIVKVIVTTYLNDQTDVYALKKFVAGSGEWSYGAALVYGNLEVGDTKYVIVGEDAHGLQSEPLEVVLRVE